MENLLHLARDQHPVCPNRALPSTLISELVPFLVSKSMRIRMLIDAGENLYWFDRIN